MTCGQSAGAIIYIYIYLYIHLNQYTHIHIKLSPAASSSISVGLQLTRFAHPRRAKHPFHRSSTSINSYQLTFTHTAKRKYFKIIIFQIVQYTADDMINCGLITIYQSCLTNNLSYNLGVYQLSALSSIPGADRG